MLNYKKPLRNLLPILLINIICSSPIHARNKAKRGEYTWNFINKTANEFNISIDIALSKDTNFNLPPHGKITKTWGYGTEYQKGFTAKTKRRTFGVPRAIKVKTIQGPLATKDATTKKPLEKCYEYLLDKTPTNGGVTKRTIEINQVGKKLIFTADNIEMPERICGKYQGKDDYAKFR